MLRVGRQGSTTEGRVGEERGETGWRGELRGREISQGQMAKEETEELGRVAQWVGELAVVCSNPRVPCKSRGSPEWNRDSWIPRACWPGGLLQGQQQSLKREKVTEEAPIVL